MSIIELSERDLILELRSLLNKRGMYNASPTLNASDRRFKLIDAHNSIIALRRVLHNECYAFYVECSPECVCSQSLASLWNEHSVLAYELGKALRSITNNLSETLCMDYTLDWTGSHTQCWMRV